MICSILNLFSLHIWWTSILSINKFRAISSGELWCVVPTSLCDENTWTLHICPITAPNESLQLWLLINILSSGFSEKLCQLTCLHFSTLDRDFFLILKIFPIWNKKYLILFVFFDCLWSQPLLQICCNFSFLNPPFMRLTHFQSKRVFYIQV